MSVITFHTLRQNSKSSINRSLILPIFNAYKTGNHNIILSISNYALSLLIPNHCPDPGCSKNGPGRNLQRAQQQNRAMGCRSLAIVKWAGRKFRNGPKNKVVSHPSRHWSLATFKGGRPGGEGADHSESITPVDPGLDLLHLYF